MLTREEAINLILKDVTEKDIIISSTGMNSRTLYKLKDRDLNYYIMGSLGASISIGLGLSIYSNKRTIVLTGDGDCLMELGTLKTIDFFRPKNLDIFVLNNREHASTGGQETVHCRFQDLAPYNVINVPIEKGKGNAPRIPLSGKQIKERFLKALK